MEFSYFQEHESEQFTFFRIPKILFSDERFAGLSSEAKILYGLMLDRVGLSRKNGWIDQNGNVYIQYTIEEMMSVLKWTRYRIYQLLDELDTKENGIGLIERKRVGLNKPNLIYVKNFASVNRTRGEPEVREPDVRKSDISDIRMSESQISGSLSARVPEVCQSDANRMMFARSHHRLSKKQRLVACRQYRRILAGRKFIRMEWNSGHTSVEM